MGFADRIIEKIEEQEIKKEEEDIKNAKKLKKLWRLEENQISYIG